MKKIFLLLVALLYVNVTFADSFLTSTEFSKAYQNKRIVKEAKSANQLNDKLIAYILKKKNPIAVKLAIINQLGWDFEGRKINAEIFALYIIDHGIYKDFDDMLKNADEEILICMAYMKAMGDYFDVSEAKYIARQARSKDKKGSYTISMICALIEAQEELHNDNWCKAYQICDAVRNNKSLKKDLKKGAQKIVFDYVDLYQEYC